MKCKCKLVSSFSAAAVFMSSMTGHYVFFVVMKERRRERKKGRKRESSTGRVIFARKKGKNDKEAVSRTCSVTPNSQL